MEVAASTVKAFWSRGTLLRRQSSNLRRKAAGFYLWSCAISRLETVNKRRQKRCREKLERRWEMEKGNSVARKESTVGGMKRESAV